MSFDTICVLRNYSITGKCRGYKGDKDIRHTAQEAHGVPYHSRCFLIHQFEQGKAVPDTQTFLVHLLEKVQQIADSPLNLELVFVLHLLPHDGASSHGWAVHEAPLQKILNWPDPEQLFLV